MDKCLKERKKQTDKRRGIYFQYEIFHLLNNFSLDKLKTWYDERWTIYMYRYMQLLDPVRYEPHRDKTCLWGFLQSEIQTSLLSYRE